MPARGSMQGRGCQANMYDEVVVPLPGDIYVLTDGKRDYLHRPLMDAFTPKGRKTSTEASVRRFTHYASEESLRARKTLVRGSDSLPQQGTMFCVSATTIVGEISPERRHIMYSGTSRGDIIGPIVLPTLAAHWQLPFGKKRELYGERLFAGCASDTDARSARKDETLEPVFYNHFPLLFYENMYSLFLAETVIDLSAGPGEAAKAALRTKTSHLGICLTDAHLVKLYRYLTHWTLMEMGTEGSPLYSPKYVESTSTADSTPETQSNGKEMIGNKEKEASKAKGSKKSKKEVDPDDDDGVEPEETPKKQKEKTRAMSASEEDSGSA